MVMTWKDFFPDLKKGKTNLDEKQCDKLVLFSTIYTNVLYILHLTHLGL